MRNRILTDALREVRGTLGRFLSLLVLSALAVSFLAGLKTTAPDMERSADAYYDGQGLMDARVVSTLGLTQADVDALGRAEGVERAEGAYTIDAIVRGAGNDFIVKALSISEKGLNLPRLVEGRLPEGDGECLVEPQLLTALGIALGDTVTLDTGTGSFEDALERTSFTVVGTADSPLYISVERGSSSLGSGRVTAFLLLPAGAFQMETYTDVYLRAEGAQALVCYSEAYEALTDGWLERLEPLARERERGRYDQVVGEANEKLADAQREFDDAQAEADQKLGDAQAELDDARRALDDGWRDYHEGRDTYRREMADAEAQIRQAEETDLPDALRKLEDGEAEYADGAKTLQDGWADYEQGLKDYLAGLGEYREGYDELVVRDGEYNDALQKLRDGEAEYAAGFQKYGRGLDALQEGGAQIQENEKKLADALDQLFDGRQALSAGQSAYSQGQQQYEAGKAQFDGQVSAVKGLLGMGGMENDAFITALDQTVTPETQDAVFAAQIRPTIDALNQVPEPDPDTGTPEEWAAYQQAQATLALLPADGDALYAVVRGLVRGREELDQSAALLESSAGQLASAERSLSWGEMEYEDGRRQLSAAKQTFYSSAEELKQAGKTLSDSRKELDDGWRSLRDGERQLDEGWGTLNTAKEELADAETALDDAWNELQDGKQELVDARVELDQGWEDYRQGLLDLQEAKDTLAQEGPKGARALADALAQLEDGEAEYADGLAEYQDAKAEAEEQLSDARRTLNDARRKIADIEQCKWYLLGRGTNMGYVSFQSDAQRMGNLASVFPLIFFLVAALVCLTTMTRMVEEHRVQIGSLKALGYGPGAISVKYVGYGLGASLIGGLLGLALGCTLIPTIIYTAWTTIHTVGPLIIPFYPDISLFSVGAAVLTVAGAAWLTCRSALREVPAALMRPKAPKMGKRVLLERVGFLWRRLSFSHKVTVRNLFRYKRRFWMTVVGIGGCTALIVTGFGLRDSIFSIMEKQYEELFCYTSQVGLVEDVTEDELAELHRALDRSQLVTEYRAARQERLSVQAKGGSVDAAVLAPVQDGFTDFITLRHRLTGAPVALPEEGAVFTEKLATLLGVGVGDTVTLDGDQRVEVVVADIVENYITHYVYLSPAAYEVVYGRAPEENFLLARYTQDSRAVADQVSAELISLAGVTSVSRISDTRQTYQQSIENVDYAVMVIIAAAAALAFVVLFNLTNINITERLRELATLKVLGFQDGELRAYVFRENALLTLFGVAAGLVMGKFLHQWLVLTVEIDMLMFGRQVKPMSYLMAVGLTILFSVTVNLVAGRKLKGIDMVESLKTVE